MASPQTLLIGYYHGVLLRDIKADSLVDDMCSSCLLSTCDKNIISTGYSVHHRNWMLLEYVQHMEIEAYLMFCKLLLSQWPEIGSQLITGMCKVEYHVGLWILAKALLFGNYSTSLTAIFKHNYFCPLAIVLKRFYY